MDEDMFLVNLSLRNNVLLPLLSRSTPRVSDLSVLQFSCVLLTNVYFRGEARVIS